MLQALTSFTSLAFGSDFSTHAEYEFQAIVRDEVSAAHPIILASLSGYDASFRVDSLVRSSAATCASIAMGSAEGITLAEQAIATAARAGTWVLLKNVHLAPEWLGQLEKRLHSLSPNSSFRLFLTTEANPTVPVNILRQSRVLMNEPAPGIRANLLDTLHSIPSNRLNSGPAEKPRIFFLLAWFHAVLQERLRYVPLGWSKGYEFNESDQEAALNTIDSWLNAMAKGKANVDPAKVPWDALRTLIKQAVYGGRVDSDFDQRVIDAFVDQIFTSRAYEADFKLVEHEVAGLRIPEGTSIAQFVEWVESLPEKEPLAWLNLPKTAEALVAAAEGE